MEEPLVDRDRNESRDNGEIRWALRHPRLVAPLSGLMIYGWAQFVVGDYRISIGSGIGLAVLQLYLWSANGPFRRQAERAFGDTKSDD